MYYCAPLQYHPCSNKQEHDRDSPTHKAFTHFRALFRYYLLPSLQGKVPLSLPASVQHQRLSVSATMRISILFCHDIFVLSIAFQSASISSSFRNLSSSSGQIPISLISANINAFEVIGFRRNA